MLHSRVKNHRTDKKLSLFKHIQTFSTYQQAFHNVLGVDHNDASQKQRLDVFESYFTIAEKNLLNKNERKSFEGMLTCFEKPSRNEHKKLRFLCICFLKTPINTAIT
jgi:hypothetical protein